MNFRSCSGTGRKETIYLNLTKYLMSKQGRGTEKMENENYMTELEIDEECEEPMMEEEETIPGEEFIRNMEELMKVMKN